MIELGSLDHSRTACTLSCPSLQSPVSMVCPHLTMSKPGLWFVKGHYVNSTYSYSFHPPSTSISSWFLIFTNCQNWPRFNRWRYACSSGGIGGLMFRYPINHYFFSTMLKKINILPLSCFVWLLPFIIISKWSNKTKQSTKPNNSTEKQNKTKQNKQNSTEKQNKQKQKSKLTLISFSVKNTTTKCFGKC